MKEQFINRYPLSKTLRFSLIPIGKTEEHFNANLLLEQDKKRAKEYEKVKEYIDRYHRSYIESMLSNFLLDGVKDYAALYYKPGKDEKDLKTMEKAESAMRKSISDRLTKNPMFKSIFGKEMVKEILPEFLTNKDELKSVEMFQDFTTYFYGFYENRKNMYSAEAQSTAISYRCINDNLPKFLDNANSFKKVAELLADEDLEELNENCFNAYGINAADIFNLDYFSFVLSQSGIDRYNGILGGYTCSDGTKVKGLNEYINLYNQQVAKTDKSVRLPLMKHLFKQILSDKKTISFVIEKFKSDNEVVSAVNSYYSEFLKETLPQIRALFADFKSFDSNGIHHMSGLPLTSLSNAAFGSWSAITTAWNEKYESEHPPKKGIFTEKYYEDEKKKFNSVKSFNLRELQELGSQKADGNIFDYFTDEVEKSVELITESYKNAEYLLTSDYEKSNEIKLCKNDKAIEQMKSLLDSIKDLEKLVKPLLGTGKEENKDEIFYGQFLPLFENLSLVDKLYDKVRNHITQKPYSKDKIKLNFENSQLLNGWDKNKERDYRTVLLRKSGFYYLAIMDKSNNKAFVNIPPCSGMDCYEKIEYKLLPGPNKMLPKVFFASSNLSTFNPSNEILSIRKNETFKKGMGFNKEDCHKLIDFFKESIDKHEDWSQFGFEFTPTEKYNDISEFYNEVKEQGYSITFKDVSVDYIDSLVESGQLYLFKIYNKDFSEYSHGKQNLHTMYFKMLFDERNLKDVVYQLNGGAEMFYREASINDKEKITHPANQPLKNKNPDNQKATSTFDYELIKDRRFTKRQFSLHVPITLNFKAPGKNFINNDVRLAIKRSEKNYVIGIDRGERNLLYICVIDNKGNIVYQKSLNEIISDNGYKVDYHELLESKEAQRDKARKSWGTIENIKELKEGYLSLVVHEICKLVLKYDAVVAMEDLNFGFKNGRFKVEKQVYQKFENMLISKLNYLVNKDSDPEEIGGLLNAYQLTNKVDGVNKGRQNGIIFYVPAWLTSKIDPTTGFVDLIHPKYQSVADSISFFEKVDDIRFNSTENMFEFDIDYDKFPKASSSYKKKWTIYSNGERIINYRNPEKNNEFDNKTIVLTDEYKALFSEFGVDICGDIKSSIVSISNKDFHHRLIKLFAQTLQMRNSETGNVAVDYLISPVKNERGEFFDSRNYKGSEASLPESADANGAYNIARKALWAIEVLKNTADDELDKANLTVKNAEWLEYAQK